MRTLVDRVNEEESQKETDDNIMERTLSTNLARLAEHPEVFSGAGQRDNMARL
jgi:hypothetical protein